MVQVICHDIAQVIDGYVVDGMMLTWWDAAKRGEKEVGERETVPLYWAC